MNKKTKILIFFAMVMIFSVTHVHAVNSNITNLNTTDSLNDYFIGYADFEELYSDGDASFSDKNQTELTSLKNSTYGYYDVGLVDSNTTAPLSNKSIRFTADNTNYSVSTNGGGVAGIDLKLNPGIYSITAYFEGDNLYESTQVTSQVKILPTIKASNLSKYYKGATYTATFFDSYGNKLKNRLVTISVNGKSYSRKTNDNGLVSMAINLKPGTYKIISTNPSTGYRLTTTFKVLSTITSSDLKKVAGDSKKFSAKFFKSNGKPLVNKYVKFKVKGKIYNVKTNSKGQAFLSLNKLKKGTYKIISYNIDGLTKTSAIKVYSISSTKITTSTNFYTFVSGDKKIIQIKFTTSLDDSSNSGKIIKIKINGKTYSKKTDTNGIVNFKFASLSKGLYTFEYSFAGNKFFKPSKSTNLVTILEEANPKLTVKSTTKFGYGANTLFKVAFTADGVPLAKRTMTFTIDGTNYVTTTDNNGVGTVPIDLKIGNYTVNYKTDTKFKVNGTSGSCQINVFERANSKLTWECGTSFKDSSQSFKVLLTDLNGKAIGGQTVRLTIDGKTYSGKTDSNGYATIKTSVAVGKYNVSVKFVGSNDFLVNSTSKSVTVSLSKFGSGLNEKTSSSYSSSYLKSSSHCQVNSAKIKSLVKSLTNGLKNDIDKAKAIFNYVRDNIVYSYYYDSHKGATGTLNAKSGNCVDQAHLLVSMYRTAGFKARYVHGTCKFSDGTFGHVWTQVLIGKTWIVGDPISYKNSLGKIKNWNADTYKLHSRYLSLPF